MTTSEPGSAAMERIIEGLENVTRGPWVPVEYRTTPSILRVDGPSDIVVGNDGICQPERMNDRTFVEDAANMRHIARCDPDTMRSIGAYIETLTRERDEAREALKTATGEPVVWMRKNGSFATPKTYVQLLESSKRNYIPLFAAASLPPVEGEKIPKVKALEWLSDVRPFFAVSPFCTYRIAPVDDDTGLHWQTSVTYQGSTYRRHETEAEAKAAAQADYESRILSALAGGKPE